MGKEDKALEYAEVANRVATHALATVHTQGIIFEALIAALRDNGVLTQEAIARIFHGAAATIDDAGSSSDLERQTAQAMRDLIERVAKGLGVMVPPPGEINLPRRH